MVLNWQKLKEKEMNRVQKEKSFATRLLILPITIFVSSFLVIGLAFNLIMASYITSLTKSTIEEEFSLLEATYNETSDAAFKLYAEREDSLFVTTELIFLDENRDIFEAEGVFENSAIDGEIKKIAQYFKKSGLYFQEGQAKTFDIGNRTYVGEYKTYQLRYMDGYFAKPLIHELGKQYYVFVYSDVTSLQNILDKMNYILIGILFIFGFLVTLLLVSVFRQASYSLKALDTFLTKIGKREEITSPPNFSYIEFAHIVDTTMKMSEEITKSEMVQKQFFQNASHELRTPLMSIQGYTEGLKYGVMKDKEKTYDIILKETEKMTNLVNEILSLTKFEYAKPNRVSVKIEDILNICINSFIHQIKQKGLVLEVDVEDNLDVLVDEVMLERAISNLISNAVRYAQTKIAIVVKQENDIISFHIIDDGKGINAKDRSHIFERFYKGEGGNFGIGLSLAKELIEKNSGKLYLTDKVDQTEFIIELPIH